jgi:hypothetical protein
MAAVESTGIFHSKALKMYQNLIFWYRNIPSGNPGQNPSQINGTLNDNWHFLCSFV